jgi:transcriptional regulator with XRE-family HTH domain
MTLEIIHTEEINISEEEFYIRLGKGLKNLRYNQGKHVTQSDVANYIGCTFQQVQKYEKGVNRPSEFRSRKMIEYLGMDYNKFLIKYGLINEKSTVVPNS